MVSISVAVAEVGRRRAVEVVDLGGGDPRIAHHSSSTVGGEPVVDVGAGTSAGDQPGAGEGAQVVGGVGDRLVDLVGDLVDGALALGEQLDDLRAPPDDSAGRCDANPSNSASLASGGGRVGHAMGPPFVYRDCTPQFKRST
jgi:hypothetical protein